MCGIAALVGLDADRLDGEIRAMTNALTHRGPDDVGLTVLREDFAALGMRRLSVVDIAHGAQPMWNEDRTQCLVFNGEIYNAADLRRALVRLGHVFATHHSDTEVVVHGFEEWGEDLFGRLNGMFAVAIWDRATRRLTVARDRAGEKPLYVAEVQGGFAIASELKAVLALRGASREIDVDALEQYLAFDYVIGPRTMLSGVRKLPAGHWGTIADGRLNVRPYWTPEVGARSIGEVDAMSRLDALLADAVKRRMIADVPVGLFLSGGLDSTTVGYYMRQHSDDVRSFSIGFEEKRFDESSYARLAAKKLGTRHHLEVFSPARVRSLIPEVTAILDEPMGDQSVFPTYLLSTCTRRDVKVALGGDGSDELLMGYNAYRPLRLGWALDSVPASARRAAALVARRLPAYAGPVPLRGVVFARHLDRSPAARLLAHLGSYKGDARWILSNETRERLQSSPLAEAERVLTQGLPPGTSGADQTVVSYIRGYLQEDILVKVDRASMAASLEVRAPFLDPILMDFLIRLPTSLRLRRFTGKYLLKRLMRGRIPDELIDRRKTGFGVPLNEWFRDGLAPMVRETLSPERISAGRVFDARGVQRLVDDHLAGKHDHGHKLWLLIQFELWQERWLATSS